MTREELKQIIENEDDIVVIPQKEIVNELRWIRNFFSTTIEQCGVFNSKTEKEHEIEKIEYSNDTVDDIISELNDFFNKYTMDKE